MKLEDPEPADGRKPNLTLLPPPPPPPPPPMAVASAGVGPAPGCMFADAAQCMAMGGGADFPGQRWPAPRPLPSLQAQPRGASAGLAAVGPPPGAAGGLQLAASVPGVRAPVHGPEGAPVRLPFHTQLELEDLDFYGAPGLGGFM